MRRVINWVTGLKWSTLVGAVVIIGIGAFIFVGKGTSGENLTLIVKSGDFIKQTFVSGTVKATQNVNLGFAMSGRISGVYVKVGDVVTQGKILAEIENGDLRAAVLQKQAALEKEQAILRSLEEGTRPEQLAVTKSQVSKDEAALLQTKQDLVNAIRDAYNVADDAVRNQIDQFMSNPRSANPQVNFVTSGANLKNKIESARVVVESKLTEWQTDLFSLVTESDLYQAEAEARTILYLITTLLTDANAALNQGVGNQATIDDWISDVSAARTAINSTLSSLTSAVTAVKNAEAALDISKKNLALDVAGSTKASLDGQKAQVRSAEADVLSARSQLLKTMILAPFTGVVTKLESKVGAIASSNSEEISLISNGGFEIESYIPEVDIAEIRIGHSARVTLDAYGEGVVFNAEVSLIEPAETIRDGVSTYKTILRFITQDERVRSGMTANVVITTESKTGVISIPQKIVTLRDGKKIVFVRQNGTDVEREVETGKVSSLGDIEIISGLLEGEEVLLSGVDK